MGKDDYAGAGGALKLKGAKNAGVDKKRKKDKKKEKEKLASQSSGQEEATEQRNADEGDGDLSDVAKDHDDREHRETSNKNGRESTTGAASPAAYDVGKTEAQRRHEEMRRRRLDERLKREGVKTHKERVEELNKYLSTLSEHHDMPRIGPG